MAKRYCSLPDIGNLREWFEKHFGDICEEHDGYYESKAIPQLAADITAISRFWDKSLWVGCLVTLLYPLWGLVGAYYWFVKNS